MILSDETLRMVVQPKLRHSNKTLSYGNCQSNSRCKDKDYMKDIPFIWFIPGMQEEEICKHAFSLRSFVSLDRFIVA